MDLSEVNALLDPTPLPVETGYERLPNGVLHVAVRADMHRCTGAMLEWWFRFRPNTQQYIWWHPRDHISSGWQGELSDKTHVGSEHVIIEEFTGLPAQDVIVQFRDPAEFFDRGAYEAARSSGAISAAIVGRVGFGHQPDRTDDGRVLGSRLLHIGRDTSWGLALRNHFFLGQDLPGQGISPDEIANSVTESFAVAILQHAYNEFTFLSRFLPSLYLGEHRDTQQVPLPW